MIITQNPSSKPCWETCAACYRCKDKGRYTKCHSCSGRHDPFLRTDPDPDDFCSCTEGILRWRAKDGRLIVSKYRSNPFATKLITETKTQDEKDWEAYVWDLREKLDNPNYDPILIDGKYASSHFKDLGSAPNAG